MRKIYLFLLVFSCHHFSALGQQASPVGADIPIWYNSSGKLVGVGSSSLSTAPLTVTGEANGNVTLLRLWNKDASFTAEHGASLAFANQDGRDYVTIGGYTQTFGTETHGYLAFFTRSAESLQERMRLTAEGFLGLGSTTPHALLSLGKSIVSQKLLLYDDGMYRYGFGIEPGELRQFAASDGVITFGSVSNTNGSTFTEKVRITTNGSVGIGTATPGENARLDVKGGINIGGTNKLDASLHIKQSYGGFQRLTQINPTGINQPGLNLMASTDATGNPNWWAWGVLATGEWALQPQGHFEGNQGLFINRTGNVLIGKTFQANSAYKLDVAGKMRADEIVVNTNGADFVFAKEYTLKPLTEVEQYIKVHQHLPEIPSATDMQSNGVSLGELNTKLLQKIEELTLYVIEQNKKLEALSAENGRQNQQLESLRNK